MNNGNYFIEGSRELLSNGKNNLFKLVELYALMIFSKTIKLIQNILQMQKFFIEPKEIYTKLRKNLGALNSWKVFGLFSL